MQTTVVIKQIERSVQSLQKKLLDAVSEGVREMILRYPFIDNYDQAMGSATFNITLDGHSFMISINSDHPLHDVENYVAINELPLDPKTLHLFQRFENDCRKIQDYHDAWSDNFTGALAGDPLTIVRRDVKRSTWPYG